jgi:hypothetical protein
VSAPSRPTLQAEIEARLRFEMLLADVFAQFVNVAPRAIDSKILNTQRVICESLNVDHCAVWHVSEENADLFVMTHVYRDPNPATPGRIRPQAIPHDLKLSSLIVFLGLSLWLLCCSIPVLVRAECHAFWLRPAL